MEDLDPILAARLQLKLDDSKRQQGREEELLLEISERRLAQIEAHRAQRGRKIGGAAKLGTKKCPRILKWLLRELRSDPGATNEQLAARFPEDDDYLYLGKRGFVDDGKGDLSRYGFDRYVTDARKELSIARRSPSRTT